jgi:uncharacterized protein YnzC (UPF0291/DUF896 family)
MVDKSEKYLKSIDDTFKDILKELKIINNKGVYAREKKVHNSIAYNEGSSHKCTIDETVERVRGW